MEQEFVSEREYLLRLIEGLADLLKDVQHGLDSALQVAMRVDDWKQHYLDALQNELLAEQSTHKTAWIKQMVARLRANEHPNTVAAELAKVRSFLH